MQVRKQQLELDTKQQGGSSPSTSCQIDGETMETVTDFIFLGSKVTADGDFGHEIERCLRSEEHTSELQSR